MSEKIDLISGIEQDARQEAERILEEARQAARERVKTAEAQAQALTQEAEGKARAQAEKIAAQGNSTLRMESRRLSLRLREQVVQEVLKRVRERLAALVGAPGYRSMLEAWIVEAAIGLGSSEAQVNASAAELKLIDSRLLRSAEARVEELTGRKVKLQKAGGDPLLPQGVVLRAASGRVEFNNQVSTRLLRLQSEIRKTIQDIIWMNE